MRSTLRDTSGVFDESAAKNFGHYTLGNIVARGAESAGGNDEVGGGEGSLDSVANVGGIITDCTDTGNLPALFAKDTGDETRVGIGNAPEQYFVADDDY